MKRVLLFSLLVVVLVALGQAQAQAPGQIGQPPITQPTFSPYLNLLRGGNPAVNYYGLVRPEQQWRSSVGQLQQQVQDLNSTAAAGPQGEGSFVTGHPTQFQNVSHYFPLSRLSGASSGRSGSPASVTPNYPMGGAPAQSTKGSKGK